MSDDWKEYRFDLGNGWITIALLASLCYLATLVFRACGGGL
jgi:hypothetical protein